MPATNWTAYRGGPRRLGLNATALGPRSITSETRLRLRLGDSCRSLLGYDGHLIAISSAGVIEIADPSVSKSVCRFQTQGPITAEPCILNGILFLATRGRVSAYSLAALMLRTPRTRPLWQQALNGTPIQALTAVADRLYVTVASTGRRDVQRIETITTQPTDARTLITATDVSWIAADPQTSQAVVLSDGNGNGVELHVLDDDVVTYPVPLHAFREHPIAFLGGAVFAVFGDEHQLYRIDASSGAVEEPLDRDTLLFALSADAEDQWDRDSVRVENSGVHFGRYGVRDSFAPHERATKGSPLIVHESAAIVGMSDGRVRVYNLAQLPRHEVWRVGDAGDVAITALASFDTWVAAGNEEGVVEVRELRAARGPR